MHMRRERQLTAQGLNGLEVVTGTTLQSDGAATLAARELDGERLADANIVAGVEELGASGDEAGSGDKDSSGLHCECRLVIR